MPLVPGSPSFSTRTPDAFVQLISVNGRRCAKHWHRDDAGAVVCRPYDEETHWGVATHEFQDFEGMCRALAVLMRDPRGIVIRGGLRDDAAPMPEGGWVRRIHGDGAPFTSRPRRWVALDFDGIELPAAEVAADTARQIDWIIAQLPPVWHGISCVYQFTSSHGMTPERHKFRVRLWFMVDAPVGDMAWRTYWQPLINTRRLNLDASLFRAVQPHYVCAPTFEGVTDPCGASRFGVVDGIMGTVVPISLELTEAQRLVEPAGGVTCEALPPGLVSRQQIEATLQRIRMQQTTGARHYHLLGACCELVGVGCPYDVAAPVLEDLVRRQGREPAPREVPDAWGHAVRRQAQGTLTTDNPPVAAQFPPEGSEEQETPEQVQARVVENEQLRADVMEWSGNDHLNARLYLRTQHPNGTFLRTGQVDYEWDSGRWVALESDEVLAARVATLSAMKFSKCADTARSIRAISTREGLIAPAWIPTGQPAPQCVSFANGILDVARWRVDPQHPAVFMPPSPTLFTHSRCPYEYDPAATCPAFDAFLESAFPTDEVARREILKMLGYLITPDTSQQKMFILGGVPGSGKSTLINLIQQLVGHDSCCSPSIANLATQYGPQSLLGKSLALVSEANNGGPQKAVPLEAVDLIKRITGCDPVQIDRKYREPLSLRMPIRFLLACNRLPNFLDPSGAMARRVQLFWMRQSFVGREDRSLPARLTAELPGIANRALQGLRMLMDDGGFRPVPSAAPVMHAYIRQMSPVMGFMEDCLDLGADFRTPAREIYDIYRLWAVESGRSPLGAERLMSEICDHNHEIVLSTTAGPRMLTGVKVRSGVRELLSSFGS